MWTSAFALVVAFVAGTNAIICPMPPCAPGCKMTFIPPLCPRCHCPEEINMVTAKVPVPVDPVYPACRTSCPPSCDTVMGSDGCVECMCPRGYNSEVECAAPNCPYACGYKLDDNGCATCDCEISPIDPECPSLCPADCGQKRLANGCLKCICDMSPWARSVDPPCIKECPQDCGEIVLDNNCLQCVCDEPYFPVDTPRPPRARIDEDCPQVCPQDCGQKRLANGCLKCICGMIPWVPSRRVDPPCIKECPQDCGQVMLDNNCLQCFCDGPYFPVETPPPPHQTRRDEDCPQVCPQDCGQFRKRNGCLECVCDGPFFPVDVPHRPYIAPLPALVGTTPLPCRKQPCPTSCVQNKRSDGCIECECDEATERSGWSAYSCRTQHCPPNCGQSIRSDGCIECHCGVSYHPNYGHPGNSHDFGSRCPPVRNCPGYCFVSWTKKGCQNCDCPSNMGNPLESRKRCPVRKCPGHCSVTRREDGCQDCNCLASNSGKQCPFTRCPGTCEVSRGDDGCQICNCPSGDSIDEACRLLACPSDFRCENSCDGPNCKPQCIYNRIKAPPERVHNYGNQLDLLLTLSGTAKGPNYQICSLNPEPGDCRADKPRYYYNKRSSKCEYFRYGGCGGNANRFATKEECEAACVKVLSCPYKCPQDCGQKVLPTGCLQCICDGPIFPPKPRPRPQIQKSKEFRIRKTPEESNACMEKCPMDCGCLINDFLEVRCPCDPNSFDQALKDIKCRAKKCNSGCTCSLDNESQPLCLCGGLYSNSPVAALPFAIPDYPTFPPYQKALWGSQF